MTADKFPIGTRVAVYDNGNRKTGVVIEPLFESSRHMSVRLDDNRRVAILPQQCRRLVPKKKGREWWLFKPTDTIEDLIFIRSTPPRRKEDQWVRVREVLP